MNQLDWIVLITTLAGIMAYGIYKSRTTRNLDGYFLSNRSMPWWLVLLSIMGTQASAVTFLAAPGQAYTDGMRFVQYYFGLPLVAIVVCVTFIPVFTRLKLITAYEYLEKRFDTKTRTFTSSLFLIQRGLSTGISIFAPSIILSTLLDWNIYWTNLFMGGLLIIYTVSGGARAVAYTQQLQLVIIFAGMFIAGYYVVKHLPANVGFTDALEVGGKLGRMNVITTGFTEGKGFDWGDRYNIISGMIGGFFLLLSYFGADQSQVGRYLTARSMTESRIGVLMNGIVKVPMQFLILLVGILVFTFYQFNKAPAFFNQKELTRLEQSPHRQELVLLQERQQVIQEQKKAVLTEYGVSQSEASIAQLRVLQGSSDSVRKAVQSLVKKNGGDDNDTNYIFLRFVIDYLPVGLVGLLIAIIFLASWGSIAAALNSLASSTVIDFHKRFSRKEASEEYDYKISKWYTLAWGLFCMSVAMFASNIGNSLIEAVNLLGSLFYGTILGVFLVAFYCKSVKGTAVFAGAIVAELLVVLLFMLNEYGVIGLGFLWLNAIGALAVVGFSYVAKLVWKN
ncbi:MAG: sodium:solute symporter [Sphingobacteriales bacterium]|jgi:SSS family transporter|nr:sodium:solute symporter [Sphingobacteriales bacterium]NCT73871.1 sodium:solute symporter [Chitinophagaceae bacterium]OJW34314.1 MAG: sodium:solute symporter [Sphingobacteriales bacterium 46-32]